MTARWWDAAACRGSTTAYAQPWDLEQHGKITGRYVRRLAAELVDGYCSPCPVRASCLADALQERSRGGFLVSTVRGGRVFGANGRQRGAA